MEEGNNKKLNYLFPSFLPVCPFSNIHPHADVSLMKFNASDQTVGHGLKLNKLSLELFIKMPLKGSFKVLESMRCLLRNVKRC